MDAPRSAAYRAALARLDARIALEIARLRARYQLSLDEFRGLYVSDEQVDALIAGGGTIRAPAEADIGAPLSPCLADCPRWSHLAATFRLSPLEQDVLLVALAPELDLKYETLYAYLNDDVTRKWATADLAGRLLDGGTSTDVLRALAPSSALRTRRLVHAIDPPTGRPSLLNTGYSLTAAVSRFVQGIGLTPSDGDSRQDDPADRRSTTQFPAAQLDQLHRIATLLARGENRAPAVMLSGPPGSGRMRGAHAIARELGLPLRVLDLRVLRRAGTPVADAVADSAIEASLERAVVCVRDVGALADVDGRLPPDMHGLLGDFADVPAPLIVLSGAGDPWRDLLGARRTLVVEFGAPDYAQRRQLWKDRLDQSGLSLPDADCGTLADRFRFTSSQVADAVATAGDWLDMRGNGRVPDLALLRDAARAQSRSRLGSLASLGDARFAWDDLVLPAAVLARLKELASAIRLRHVIYGDWGFARRFAGGSGVKALFAGPSGTGKTMAAGVIAHESGLDLIKVDLSGLVSKYIGETEKNLDRVFAGARAGNALIFFDEAEAIFGKRSEVKDAHDRYANIEVAYLLQKIEEHDGVVLLATNLRRNVDDAFSRRLHYVVDFPQPDASLRERLWRGMIPAEAPVAEDVDFAFLAKQFDLAGGDIRNVVLDAAFLAAEESGRIEMRHVIHALSRQMAKQGKTPSRAEFRQYHGFVGTGQRVDVRGST